MENKYKLNVVICDLDGTLSLFEKEDKTQPHYRNPYDASTCDNDVLNGVVASIIKDRNVIFVSGREDKYIVPTEKFLNKHRLNPLALFMRKTGDFRKDSVVKNEIYRKLIKPFYNVEFVLDDRNQVVEMWRKEGLTCLQVADGNF